MSELDDYFAYKQKQQAERGNNDWQHVANELKAKSRLKNKKERPLLTLEEWEQRTKDTQVEKQAPGMNMPAICHMCGSHSAELYAADGTDTWVLWRPAYKKEKRKFLCSRCATLVPPSLMFSLVAGSKEFLRATPLYDESGNMLPATTKARLEVIPEYYPLRYLGEKRIVARWTDRIEILDGIVLKLKPLEDQESYMDIYLAQLGYIYTHVKKWYPLPSNDQLNRFIAFDGYFDKSDRYRVDIKCY